MDKALLTLGLSLVPFAWGFYLLFAYRNSKERVLAYLAIAVSLLWVGMSTHFLIQVMKERRIYRSKALEATAAALCSLTVDWSHNAVVAGASAPPAAVPQLGRSPKTI